MASPENKLLQAWIAPVLKGAGFLKSGPTWHRTRPPFIHVLNIQGSQWSRFFYFNLGIYIAEIGDLNKPNEYQCNFRERLDQIIPDTKRYHVLCDFERIVPVEERRAEIQAIITTFAIPWLD